MNKNDEETIEIVEEDVVDLEAIVKDKLKGFRRTSPTSTPQAGKNIYDRKAHGIKILPSL